jgi:hypothetical protein
MTNYTNIERTAIVCAHEGSHTAVSYLLGVPLVAVSRDGSKDSGATHVLPSYDTTDTVAMLTALRKQMCILRAPMLTGGDVAEWDAGDRAACNTIIAAMKSRFGPVATEALVSFWDRGLVDLMRTPAYTAVKNAVALELAKTEVLFEPELRATAEKALASNRLRFGTSKSKSVLTRVAAKRKTHTHTRTKSGRVVSGRSEQLLTDAEVGALAKWAQAIERWAHQLLVNQMAHAEKQKPRVTTPQHQRDQRRALSRDLDDSIRFLHAMKRVATVDTISEEVDAFVRQTHAVDALTAQREAEEKERVAQLARDLDVRGGNG